MAPMTAPPTVTLRFDAGTLVLDGFAEGASEGATLPGCVWDPRVQRLRTPAWRYREVVTALTRMARAGAIGFTDEARGYNALAVTHRAQRAPFDHQREAIAAWKGGGNRGVVVLPTGAGKSYVAEMAIALAQRSALVVAPTLDLMNQWYDVLRTAFGEKVGLLGGGYHEPGDLTVSTYDSAYAHGAPRRALGPGDLRRVHHLPGPSFLQGPPSAPSRPSASGSPRRWSARRPRGAAQRPRGPRGVQPRHQGPRGRIPRRVRRRRR
jgi:hypothetical protein